MKFFSGFCFQDEQKLFDDYLEYNDFCVAGFSYGAIKAFEYVSTCRDRIDKLQLFSPAFFQDRNNKFKRLQTISFAKNKDKYIQNFLTQVKYPNTKEVQHNFYQGNLDELKELINYTWSQNRLEQLLKRGVCIEVYLGEKDKIINPNIVQEFFVPYSDIYFIKGVGHLLI